MNDINKLYSLWCEKAVADPDLQAELAAVKGKDEEINDRFYRNLEFGTAGLRGIIGAGTNRMNVYTVGKASQGLAEYVNSVNKKGKIAIAYDSRIKSELFARTAASVFAANGIKVYIYKDEDTIESVLEKYSITKEELANYNNLDDIIPGSKIVIPSSND